MPSTNYQIAAGTVYEAFSSLSGFTNGGTSGGSEATELDTTPGHFQVGTSGIRLVTAGGASSNRTITKTIATTFTDSMRSIDVWVPDETKINGFTIYLSEDSGFTNYHSYAVNSTVLHKGMNRIGLRRSGWSETGSPSWANQKVRVRYRVDAATNQIGDITFSNFVIGRYSRPKLIFRFDDNRATQYTVAYPILDAAGFKASVFVISSQVNVSTYMTEAQMDELHNVKGWDMCLHTHSHTDLATLTKAQQIKEFKENQKYLISRGYTRNDEHRHLVFPFGSYDDNTLQAIEDTDLLTGGTILSPRSTILPVDDNQLMTIDNIAQTVDLASAKSRVDRAIEEGGATTLLFHQFADPAVASTEWDTSDFVELVAYIKSKEAQIDVVTWTEYWRGITNPRRQV